MPSIDSYPWEQETLPQNHQLITQNGWTHAQEQHRALEAADFRDWPVRHARALTFGSVIQDRWQGPEVEVQPLHNTFVHLSQITFPPLCPESLPLLPMTGPLWHVLQHHLLGWGFSAASLPGGWGLGPVSLYVWSHLINVWCVFSIFLVNEGMKRWQAWTKYLETCF